MEHSVAVSCGVLDHSAIVQEGLGLYVYIWLDLRTKSDGV